LQETIVIARKWGNSIGVTLPINTVEKEGIKPNDKLVLCVRKIVPIQQLFGIAKFKKSGQQLKDELKKGWD